MNVMVRIHHRSVLIPFVLISIYLVFTFVLRSIFPSGQALVEQLASIYGRFGYEIVTLGSLMEALVLVNFFTGGVAGVGLGAIFARSGQLDLTLVIIFAVLGSLVGYMLDFLLGRFGFRELVDRMGYGKVIDETKHRIEKFGFQTFSLGFMHPNLGALIALTAGTLRMDFKKFFLLSFLSTLVWYILWGLLIFAMGNIFLTVLTRYTFMIFLLVGAIWLLFSIYGSKKS